MKVNYLILFFSLLSYVAPAQSKMNGLGSYYVGVTTPDSLHKVGFNEESQPVIEGTLTLPCTHIRAFTAAKTEVDGVTVTNLSLFFYDNKLFRISCDYSEEIARIFIGKHGKGKSRPANRLSFCDQGNDKTMHIWGEVWRNGDIMAVALHAKGYNTECRMEQTARLILASQPVSFLSSDCDLQPSDILTEEFDDIINES